MTGRRLFVVAMAVYLFTAGGSLTTTDAVVTFDVTRSIVEQGSVAMSGNLLGREFERGRDGRYYSPFGIGQSIANIPFYLAGRAAVAVTGLRIGKSDSIPKAAVALGQTVVVALVVWEFFLLAMAILQGGDAARGRAGAVMAALTLAFATILWPYSGFGFNQPLACCALVSAIRAAFEGARGGRVARVAHAGLWIAAGLMTRHEMMLAALPIAAWLWFDGHTDLRTRVRRIGTFLPGVAAGVLAWLAFNYSRFGNPLETGYLQDATPGFWSPVWPGVIALLFSPSASLFLYSPMALPGLWGLVGLARRDRSAALLIGTTIALFLIFYATLGNWLGGRSYGSRYLVVVLPLVAIGWAALLREWPARAAAIAFAVVFCTGAVLQLPGVLIDYAKVSQSVSVGGRAFTTEERQWQWQASPLRLNTQALIRAVPDNAAYLIGTTPPPVVATSAGDADRSFSQQFSFSLDVWWLYLYYLHALPRWVALLLVVVWPAAIAALCARAILRIAPEPVHPNGGPG